MLSGVGIHPFQTSQRHQRIGVAANRFHHFADNRFQAGRLDLPASPGGQRKLIQHVGAINQQTPCPAPFLTQGNDRRGAFARFRQRGKLALKRIDSGERGWRQVNTLRGIDTDFRNTGVDQLADMIQAFHLESAALCGNFRRRVDLGKPVNRGTYDVVGIGRAVSLSHDVRHTNDLKYRAHGATGNDASTFRCRLNHHGGCTVTTHNRVMNGTALQAMRNAMRENVCTTFFTVHRSMERKMPCRSLAEISAGNST